MKKLLALLLCTLTLLGTLAACGAGGTSEEADKAKVGLTESVTFAGVTLLLPNGFYTKEATGFRYAVNKKTSDYIVFAESEADRAENYTDENVKQIFGEKYGDDLGDSLAVERRKFDGYDALIVRGKYTQDKKECAFINVCVFLPDKCVAITYNLLTDVYSDAFENSLDTISVT